MIAHKGYKVRLYPNACQEQEMLKILAGCRFVWNHFLDLRKNHYLEHKKTLPYAEMSRQLTKLRKTAPELAGIQLLPLAHELRRLDRAYNTFFSKQNRFPKFKREWSGKQSFTRHRDWRVIGNKISIQRGFLVKYRGFLPQSFDACSITVSLVAGRWFCSVLVREEMNKIATGTPLGIDLGLASLATTSDGKKYDGKPDTSGDRIATLRRKLIRQKIGSKRSEETRKQIARAYARAANKRLDHLHKTSDAVLKESPSLVAIEDLTVSNMMKNHSLARSIAHASWGELLRQIRYKAEWRGGKVVAIDRFYPSSKTCNECFYVADSMPLSVREWTCPQCGTAHDRDINAAKVILKQGQGMPRVEGRRCSTKRKRRMAMPIATSL